MLYIYWFTNKILKYRPIFYMVEKPSYLTKVRIAQGEKGYGYENL